VSSENIELVRRFYVAVGRADVDAVIEVLDPEIVVDDPGRPNPVSPDGLHRGHEAARRHAIDWQEAFEETAMDPVEVFEASDDTVIVRVRTSARGVGSGVIVDNERYHVITLRDRKFKTVAVREDRTEALAAAESGPPT
jgi:ketosteroid isomerase-like protein